MTRTLLALVATIAALAPLRAAEPPTDLATRTTGIDWPDFLGPQRNACSPETGLDADWAGRTPRVVWQCKLGESYSAPSISRGRLFHFDRWGNVHRLTCRNAETGAQLWICEFPADYADMLGYNNGPRATPVVDGDRVYVVTPEGHINCVQAADGGRVWNIDMIEQFHVVKNFFGVASTPLVWGDLLIVNVGGSPAGSPPDVYSAGGRVQGDGTGVVAFDKVTGEVRWKATDELASYASPVIAEVAGRPTCFVFARGGLVALNPATGAAQFQFPWRAAKLESVNASSPVVVGDEVFISEAYGPGSALLHVKPLSVGGVSDADSAPHSKPSSASETPPTGEAASPQFELVWKDDLRSREHALDLHWNTAVHHDGYLYASSGQHANEAELRCVEWKSGKVMWRQPDLGRSSLLYVDGRLLCLSEDGTLRLLRATPERYEVLADLTPHVDESLRDSNDADGETSDSRLGETRRQGEPLLDAPAWAAPVLAHGLLYVRGGSRLVCLELIPAETQ